MGDFSSFITGGVSEKEKPKYSVEDVQNMVYGQESTYGKVKTDKPNYAGAVGPMQILPDTWTGLKKKGLIPQEYDINNPEHNKAGGNALIADAYSRHGGDADKVLAEYYGGGGAIKNGEIQTSNRDLKNPNAPTVGEYIDQAKNRFEGLGSDFSKFIMGGASEKSKEKQQESSSIKDFGKGIASLADVTVGSAIPFVAGHVTQAVARPFTTAEKAQELGQTVSSAVDKPFGKVLGITEEPAYKSEASQRFMNFIGENVGKGADWIAQQTGLPKQDVEHMITTLGVAVTPEVGARAKVGLRLEKLLLVLEQKLERLLLMQKQLLQTNLRQKKQIKLLKLLFKKFLQRQLLNILQKKVLQDLMSLEKNFKSLNMMKKFCLLKNNKQDFRF
jgi:hypothetical protein